jgi:hypothetical protein
MTKKPFEFPFIEQQIRRKTFGILSTVNPDNTPHTSGILYGVSNPEDAFCIYLKTERASWKAKNIQRNAQVSLIIPFPHHFLRFIPSETITITGQAELLPIDSSDILKLFADKWILRMIISKLDLEEDVTFIRINPNPKVLCYGVGFGIFELRSAHTTAGYSVMIPEDRLPK